MLPTEKFLGHTIGIYRLKQIIGKGGASVVFLAEKRTSPKKLVAVKVLLPPSSLSEDETTECHRRFARESLTLKGRLRHPSILPILASGTDPSTRCSYMVTPYISGGSLADRLKGNDLTLHKISHYVTQVAEALDYAHSQQVIHRDLKPANVLVDEQDHVYLADFGIAKILDSALAQISQPGHAIGTPEYMAPEQALGQPVSSATDIYGLAVLTYTLITKNLPFTTSSMKMMLMQVATVPPIPPRTFRPDLPEAAEAVLLRALNKDPESRFATARELAQALTQSFQIESAAKSPPAVGTSLQAEGEDQPGSLNRDTSFIASPVSALMASPIIDEVTQEIPAVQVLGQAAPLLAGQKGGSNSVLISRRMALVGLAGLSIAGGGTTLWYLLAASSAPQKNLKAPVSTSERVYRPTTGSRPKSTTPPTQQPTPPLTTGMGVVPFSVAITNIPQQVMSGDTIPVVVTTNQPGTSVTLHITYNGPIQAFNSSPQVTDGAGQTTFSWPAPPTFNKHRRTLNATVEAMASNTQGQSAQSAPVQVQITLAGGDQQG